MHTLLFGLLLAGPPEKPLSADVWPQWRGPTQDGVSPTADLPVRWGPGENVVWKKPLPGKGNSTPAVWGDAVFVTAQAGDRLLLLRLDRADGKVVWQREVGRGVASHHGQDRAQQAIVGEERRGDVDGVADGGEARQHRRELGRLRE